MRVLLCVPAYLPATDAGGPVSKLSLLAPALAALDTSVEILTADFGFGQSRVASGRRAIDGTPVTYLRRVAARGWLSLSPGTGKVISRGFDVVHCFGLRDGLVTAAALAASRRGIPFILEPMGMAQPRVRNIPVKALVDRALRPLTARASATVATSNLEARELELLGFPRVTLRPNPISIPTNIPLRGSTYDLCYVGRLHQKKRLGDVVHTLARHPEWRAMIAGPDEDGTLESILAAAEDAGVTNRLEVRGWIDADERARLIRQSRCFVLPSMTENFGNAAAEALALGVPVVVTNQCGVADLVTTNQLGRICEVGAEPFERAVADLLSEAGDAFSVNELHAIIEPAAIARRQRQIYAEALTSE